MDFLRDLPLEKAADLLHIASRRRLGEGQHLIRRGEIGDEMYIILFGEVAVRRDERMYKVYGPGDFVGDMSLVSDEPRFADVITQSPLDHLAISKSDFLRFLHGTGVLEKLRHLAEIRRQNSWPILEDNPDFQFMTANQLTQFQALLKEVALQPGEPLFGPHEHAPMGYLVIEGSVTVKRNGGPARTVGPGALIAQLDDDESPASRGPAASPEVGEVVTAGRAYRVEGPRFRRFLRANPGVWLRLAHRARYR